MNIYLWESIRTKEGSDELVNDNLGLVHSILRKFNLPDSQYQELYSEGVLGLVEAAKRYKPGKAKFSTYAYFRVKGAILNFIQNNKSIIKIPWRRNKDGEKIKVVSLSPTSEDEDWNQQQFDISDEEKGYASVELEESLKKILTNQEYEILLLKMEGYSLNEISEKIKIPQKKINEFMELIKMKAQEILK
jgi:RNA polymerase sporulation-specific sigma factor